MSDALISSSSKRNPSSISTLSINDILNSEEVDFQKLTRCCRRGLTDEARSVSWKIIMGYYPVTRASWSLIEEKRLSEYTEILMACNLSFDNLSDLNSELSRTIDIDISRTMPALHFFRAAPFGIVDSGELGTSCSPPENSSQFSVAQHALRRVLLSTAIANPGFGYVQGMNEYVGLLLYVFSKGHVSNFTQSVEASTFFCFQTLLGYLGEDFCRAFDNDTNVGLISTMRLFDNVLRFLDPLVFDHLLSLGILSEHFAMRWLVLLFTHEFNIADTIRVWDFLLSLGDDVKNASFFVAAAMCFFVRESILAGNSIGDVLPFLQQYPPCDVNSFLRIAMRWISVFRFDIIEKLKVASPSQVIALRKEYGLEVKSGLGNFLHNWMTSFF